MSLNATSPRPRVVIVTGAASGIGLATAVAFAEAGDHVLAVDVQSPDAVLTACSAFGDRVVGCQADLALVASAHDVVAEAIARFGRVDILINNAGIGIPGMIDQIDEVTFDRVWATNFRAGYLLSKHVIPHMREQGSGVILFTAAVAGHAGAQNLITYAPTKAAVINLVQSLALDHAREGIRVNAISPGPTRTAMARDAAEAFGLPIEALIAGSPLPFVSEPEEAAEAFRYLASPAARSITGHILAMDCGLLAGPFRPRGGPPPGSPGQPN